MSKDYAKIQKIILLVGGVIIVILSALYFQTSLWAKINSGEVIRLTWEGKQQEERFKEKQVAKLTEDWKTYSSAQYNFEFKYPAGSIWYGTGASTVYQTSYLTGGKIIGSIVLPASISAGTNLQKAYLTFSVADMGADVCATFNDLGTAIEAKGQREVSGNMFWVAQTNGAAAGTFAETQIFHIHKGGRCYEISQNIFSSNIGNFPEGAVKEFDKNDIGFRLDLILDTFEAE